MNYDFRKPLPGYSIAGTHVDFFDTRSAVEAICPGAYAKLPYTSRVLAEQLVRKCDPAGLTESLKQIIEVKQERKPYPSSCREFIKNKGIKSTNFSKYCMGTILTNDTAAESGALKINRFKSVINSLEKLNQLH